MKTATKNTENKELQRLVKMFQSYTKKHKSRYMLSFVEFQKSELDRKIEDNKNSKWYSKTDEEWYKERKESATELLSWLQEGQQWYDHKLQSACEKIASLIDLEYYDMIPDFRSFDEDVVQSTNQFDFLIRFSKWNEDVRIGDKGCIESVDVHARLIWVECYEKASHWRFITTKRKSK
jgi:hypothetical protein